MVRNSPSSIIAYRQCPRLYFHRYVERKPSHPHIDAIKGRVVHEALDEFFKIQPPAVCEPEDWIRSRLRGILHQKWTGVREDIAKLNMGERTLQAALKDCEEMLMHWGEDFLERAKRKDRQFDKAFQALKPETELEVLDKDHDIRGFIDVVDRSDGHLSILDYKTSGKVEISRENRLQLSLYAYLYQKQMGERPENVGIWFLRSEPRMLAVDDDMLSYAERECDEISKLTVSQDIKDYPQGTGYLCRQLGPNCPCRKYEVEEED